MSEENTQPEVNLRTMLFSVGVREGVTLKVQGQEVELRPPTVKERGEMLKSCGVSDGNPDFGKLQAYALLLCAHEPKTGRKIFESSDLDVLQNASSGSELDELGTQALKMINLDSDPEEAKND